ncbi:hypothetical protein [Deinococcus rufus]|uniref:Uncharacterized protein n=1 Tax=Deinococcus rufus TaxID=2136097 RepID=A0ABV7ZD84_9DEIO
MRAVQDGMPQREASRVFGVSVVSVERDVRLAREGRSLAPAKRPG